MRSIPLLVIIAILSASAWAVDVSDLGVPAGWSADNYDEQGHKLLNKGDYETAKKYFTAAIRVKPTHFGAFYNRAMAFAMQKNWAAAVQDLNLSVRYEPAFLMGATTRAWVNVHLHNYKLALWDLDTVAPLAQKVGNTWEYCSTLNSSAWIRATCPNGSFRNGQRAVTDAKKACELSEWKRGEIIDTLAAAYAEAGDFDSALRYQEQANKVHQSRTRLGRQEYGQTPFQQEAGRKHYC